MKVEVGGLTLNCHASHKLFGCYSFYDFSVGQCPVYKKNNLQLRFFEQVWQIFNMEAGMAVARCCQTSADAAIDVIAMDSCSFEGGDAHWQLHENGTWVPCETLRARRVAETHEEPTALTTPLPPPCENAGASADADRRRAACLNDYCAAAMQCHSSRTGPYRMRRPWPTGATWPPGHNSHEETDICSNCRLIRIWHDGLVINDHDFQQLRDTLAPHTPESDLEE